MKISMTKKVLTMLAIVGAVMSLPTASNAVVWVDNSQSDDPSIRRYDTIQEGVDAAYPGEMIYVLKNDLEYVVTQAITMSSGRQLFSWGGRVLIRTQTGLHRIFTCSGIQDVTIWGFEIKGGYVTTAGGENNANHGGGLLIEDCANIEIQHCIIRENNAMYGSGVACVNSAVIIRSCLLEDNGHQEQQGSGGGLYWTAGAPVVINSSIINNRAHYGGGLYGENGGTARLDCCEITQNAVMGKGGGIAVENYAHLVVNECQVTGNTAYGGSGGGVYVGAIEPGINTTVCVKNSTIMGNDAGVFFDGHYLHGGIYMRTDCAYVEGLPYWGGDGEFMVGDPNAPDPGNSSATTYAFETASCYCLPNGMGMRLDDCFVANGGSRLDATIEVTIRDAGGDPIVGLFPDEVWLETSGGGLTTCWDPSCVVPWAACADAPTDENGKTTFSGVLYAGGHSHPGEQCMVGTYWGQIPVSNFNVKFNSADIDGSGQVDLMDIILFSGNYFNTYEYSCDFFADGVLNLSDIVYLATGIGAACP